MIRIAAGLFGVLAVAGVANAEPISPHQARSVSLGDTSGVAYYTVAEDGFQVIATLATEGGAPVRFLATLTPGQRVVLSVPGALNEPSRDVEIQRTGDLVTVSEVSASDRLATN